MIYVIINIYNKKIKGPALMELFPDYMTTAQDSGKVVSLMYLFPLPQKMLLVLISVGGWVDTSAIVRPKGFYVNENPLTHVCDNQRCVDVCTTGDTAHIGTTFKFLPHTIVNMGASIFFTAAVICAFRSARSRGTNFLHKIHVAQWPKNFCVILQHTNRLIPIRERPLFSLHTLSTPSGTNVNYDEKRLIGGKKFLRCSFIWSGLINTCPTVLHTKFL